MNSFETSFHSKKQQAMKALHQDFFKSTILKYKQDIEKTDLFKVLSCMPKGCMQHLHIQCNPDLEFIKNHIINDPNIYLDSKTDFKKFKIGTKKEAQQNLWISFSDYKIIHCQNNNLNFEKAIYGLVSMNLEEIQQTSRIWSIFQTKIITFIELLQIYHISQAYYQHVFKKFINNGYQRLQFRSIFPILKQYDKQGNLLKTYDQTRIQHVIQSAYAKVMKQNQSYSFTIGVIASTLKRFPKQVQKDYFKLVYEMKWDNLIGVDFVNEEDPNGQLQQYDNIITQTQKKFPQNKRLNKFYHAGQSCRNDNYNIQIALKAGSKRLGHGIAIILKQKQQLLKDLALKKIQTCFEICPLSNRVLGYVEDFRKGAAGKLMQLQVPLTINPDDPGIFGYENSTLDFYVSTIAHGWNLKQLKLLGQNSIKFCGLSSQIKQKMLINFTQQWQKWQKQTL